MKRILCILVLMLPIIGCGGGSSSSYSGPGVTNSSGNESRSIVGKWELIFPGSLCEETYDFKSNNNFTINSLDEISSGTYTFTSVTSTRYKLTMTITADNGEADCEGDSSDDTGLTGTLYIEFSGTTAIRWFESQTSTTVLRTMTKV